MARLNIITKVTGDPNNPLPNTTLSADEVNSITPSVNFLYDGLDAANTSIATANANIATLQSQITSSISGFKGSLAVANTPTAGVAGYYFPSENGTYTNAGGLVVNLTDGLNVITQTAANVFTKIVVPLSLANYALKTDIAGIAGIKTTKSPNLYDVRVGTFGSILANGGGATVNAAYNISDYIPAIVGKIYTTFWDKVPVKSATTSRFYFYNSAKVAIGSTVGTIGSSGETTAAPANTAFIRVSYNNSKAQYFQVIEGDTIATTPTAFTPYGYFLGADTTIPLIADAKLIANTLSDQSTQDLITTAVINKRRYIGSRNAAFIVDSINLVNPLAAGVTVDKSVQSTTGALITTVGWTSSDYFEVTPGLTYTGISGNSAYYDSSKVYLSAPATTAPAGAAYARVSIQSASFPTKMVVQAASLPASYVSYGETLDPTLIKVIDSRLDGSVYMPFNGKAWGALGDSITFQGNYFNSLKAITGLQTPTNLGVNGQVLKTMADNLNSTNIAGMDVITLFGGTNDYGHGSTTLGTIADDMTVNSIYGVTKYLIDKILTLKPTVKLFFFTPLNRGAYTTEPTPPAVNSNGLTIQNIGKAMKETCELYAIPCFDLGSNSGINSYTFTQYLTDGLHPNAAGGTLIGNIMGKYINRYY